MKFLLFFAKRFIAGENLEDAIHVTRKLNKIDIKTTIDFLGEHSHTREEVKKNLENYFKLIRAINILKLDSNISIKLTSLGLDISKDYCIDNLKKLLKYGKKYQVMITIDMESSKYTSFTIAVYKKFIKMYNNTEIAIQCNLRRTNKDIKNLINKKPNIRLVKGAYIEHSKDYIQNKHIVNDKYIKYLRLLFKTNSFVAIATHDTKIINYAREYINKNKIKKKRYEFQMLYGIRQDIQKQLADENYPIRVYVPYGQNWLPYYVRRMREQKEILLFVLKHLFR